MNGYFQIVSRAGKCAIKLVPPTDGGMSIDREEILEYLSIKNLVYDVKLLGAALSDLKEETIIPTSTDFKFADGEFVRVFISPDNMTVTVRLIPPFEGGTLMSKNEFLREFSSRAIVYGINDIAVDNFLAKRPYCTNAVLAQGLPPVHGTDASIEYFFNTDPKIRPTLLEDGSVDFFHLNTINHCSEGDLVAKLTPATFGQAGCNVKGEKIRPRDVKVLTLKYGHNLELSEDKTELHSLVSGHVSLVEGKVFVSNVLVVENVDNSVGNIDYDGSVVVNGNVTENFSVKAKGNIEVKGVVEGAKLEAGGNITIVRGINGMHKGILTAGGNVVSKFIENAGVTAKGFIQSESIMHSIVMAGSDIKVSGKHGFISGGRASATNCIEAKTLGAQMGAETIIEVGLDAGLKKKITELQKESIEINKSLATIKPVLDGAKQKLMSGIKMSTDQLLQIQKLAEINKEKSNRLDAILAELKEYNIDADTEIKGQVVVTGDVYPGTKICIGDVSMVVKTSVKYCRFIKDAGDVKMVAI